VERDSFGQKVRTFHDELVVAAKEFGLALGTGRETIAADGVFDH
jgi:hypothetical protein